MLITVFTFAIRSRAGMNALYSGGLNPFVRAT
jgi:hypothetical protein